jgi:hypothetical protein
VSKALGQGLVEGPQSVRVFEYDAESGTVRIELGKKLRDRLPEEFAEASYRVRTLRKEDFVVATILLQSDSPCPEASMRSLEKLPVS